MTLASEDEEHTPSTEESEKSWLAKTTVGRFLSRPCVASSFLYGSGAFLTTFLATFGWTSNSIKANGYGAAAFMVTVFGASAICTASRIALKLEGKEEQRRRAEEAGKRAEEIRTIIEERKRKHEERRRILEAGQKSD